MERAGFLARSRSRLYARRVERALGLIRRALESGHGDWSVGFSGGKDSTVVLHLARSLAPELPVCWMDDGWDYPETIQYITETEARLGIHVLRITSPVMSPFWRRIPYPGDDPTYAHPSDMEFDEWSRRYQSLIGLRSEESGARKALLKYNAPIYYSEAWGHWACCPLADWTWEDVWAYIVANDIPYNPVYDKLGELGVPWEHRRVGPLTAWMVWQYGTLAVLRAGWPDLYHRFAAALPMIQSYT